MGLCLLLKRCFKLEYILFNPPDGFYKRIIIFSGWILQTPILPVGAGLEWTLDIAPHGDNRIHLWNIG